MKILIAIDSFKGSISSLEAGNSVKEGILRVIPDANCIVKPLADGGEGTAEAFVSGLGGEWVHLSICGPYGEPTDAKYAYLSDKKQAILEMAEASGITISKRKEPLYATTFGVGEMILDALKRGATSFLIGIGGSATNDAGLGMLTALGFDFLDTNGNPVDKFAKDLPNIQSIDDTQVSPLLQNATIQVACDVNNPLCGETGATYIYGGQKGVTDDMKPILDGYVSHFADITAKHFGIDKQNQAGAGAAGGLGFALLSYLHADMQSGIDLVLRELDLEQHIQNCDYVITGEGRLDAQTAMGKGPIGIAKMGKSAGATTIAFAGSILEGAKDCNQEGIDAYFPILQTICTLEEAMMPETTKTNLTNTAEQVFRLLMANKKSLF
ncbi:glycerate kinase [Chakrabartyella piscis]|uniref:glycerate kinase family protein n=1 Tax=Chakrabartyella piscis TaxID=2918914 RepID=UPI0029583F22|nr:glycerate kinase [Chakrabartyella piscis]